MYFALRVPPPPPNTLFSQGTRTMHAVNKKKKVIIIRMVFNSSLLFIFALSTVIRMHLLTVITREGLTP